jgi:AcrR family transcriptional regulator
MNATATVRYTAEDRRQQIMDIAMTLFARQGFEGTTTRQIARSAGVNEAIIFRHFPTKEELYWSIIRRKCQDAGRARMIGEKIAGGGSDLEIFSTIAESMLTRNRNDSYITRLLLFTALERHELSDEFFSGFVVQQYEMLAEYIRRRIDEGAFRRVDATLAARGFLGMVIYHYLIQELFGGQKQQDFDPRKTGATLAEIWLRGVIAKPAPRGGNGNHSRRNGKSVAAGSANL